jgi:hypothetical protein
MRELSILPGLPALGLALVTGVLLAAGFNFGYELHPGFLVGALVTGLLAFVLGVLAVALAGVRDWRLRLAAPVVAVGLCFGLVVVLAEVGDPSPEEVVREEAPLYDDIPTHPDARRGPVVAAEESPGTDMFAEGFLNQPTCCFTSRTDELQTPLIVAEVESFYRPALEADGWRVLRYGGGPNQKSELEGRRGRALLDLIILPRRGLPPVVEISVYPRGNDV